MLAGATGKVRTVRFFDGQKPIAVGRAGGAGLYSGTWRRGAAAKGPHTLRAVVTDAGGRMSQARLPVRVCG